MTFVVDNCPIRVIRQGRTLEVHLIGQVVAANCARIELVLRATAARLVTLDLRQLTFVDATGARMLRSVLDAAVFDQRAWSVVGPDLVVHEACVELGGCACSQLRLPAEHRAGW